jgi:hypothetical protein
VVAFAGIRILYNRLATDMSLSTHLLLDHRRKTALVRERTTFLLH